MAHLILKILYEVDVAVTPIFTEENSRTEKSVTVSQRSPFGQCKPPIDLRSIDVNLIRELWSQKVILNSSWSPSFKKSLRIDDKPKNLREQKQHSPKIHFLAWKRMLKPSTLEEAVSPVQMVCQHGPYKKVAIYPCAILKTVRSGVFPSWALIDNPELLVSCMP